MSLVFCNGVFDLFHIGHLTFLQRASEYGRLIVGVNSDNSVRKLKGNGRPVIPELERLAIVSSLKCVNLAMLFDEGTPFRLIHDLRPMIYVVSDEYSNRPVPEFEFIKGYGGRVEFVPRVVPRSTTQIERCIKVGEPLQAFSAPVPEELVRRP